MACIFINDSSNYADSFENNHGIINMEHYGQLKKTIYDYNFKNSDIYVWYRKKSNIAYKYLGKVVYRKIIKERTQTEPLKMYFIIDTQKGPIPFNTIAEPYIEQNTAYNYRKYKYNCFRLLNKTPLKNNYGDGIMLYNL